MVTTGGIGKICLKFIKFIKLNNKPPKRCELIQPQPVKTEDHLSTQDVNARKAG
jgi:hypothetical protein